MRVAYFVLRYPTVTQTFLEREMLALAAQGLTIEVRPIWDFRRARDVPAPPPGLTVVRAGAPWRVLLAMLAGAVRETIRRPRLPLRGLRLLIGHPPRHAEGWFMTVWGTLTGLALAAEFRRRPPAEAVDVFHGAWATAPATAAGILGTLCDRPFSFGAHAYDLYRHGGDPFLGAKLDAARFVHTTTQANVDSIRARFPRHRAKIVLARRGMSRAWYERAGLTAHARTDRAQGAPLRLLSVGRLVAKKGQIYQLEACAELSRRGVPVKLRLIGAGPWHEVLAAKIAALGLRQTVTLAGELPPSEVAAAYAWADAFWHTGVVDAQGDRDGLPNVIPEAMACGLPVISSRAGGAGEALEDEVSGLLIADPANTETLADAVERLAHDRELCRRLGNAGRQWVEANFLAEVNTRLLAQAFAPALN